MADGFLGGVSDFAGGVGDFFMGGGKYADPKNINPSYGVPEADVRQAALNTLGNVGGILLGAGQSMTGAQRGQLLAQLGPALGGMGTDIYKSSQARLMNAQQQQTMREIDENKALSAWAQNPDNLKSVGLTPEQFRVVGLPGLRTIVQTQASRDPQKVAAAELQMATRRRLLEGYGVGAQAPTITQSQAQPPQQPTAPGGLVSSQPVVGGVPQQGTAPPQRQFSQQELSILSSLPNEYVVQQLSDPSVSISKLYDEALKAKQGGEKDTFDRAKALRTDFDKVSIPFNDRQTAYMTMKDLAQNKAGSSDMALVLSIMKVFDPTSTVTGSEAATAQNAAGVPSQYIGYYNKLLGQGFLDDKARSELVRAAETRFEQEMDKYGKDLDRYRGLAVRSNVDPELVVQDYRNPELAQSRQFKLDMQKASKTIGATDVLSLGAEDLQLLDPALMKKPARDAYNARLQQLQQEAAPRAPTPPHASAPSASGYGLGQNPLGATMRQYPRGLLGADQLPPVRY